MCFFHDPSIVPISLLTRSLNLRTFLAVLFLQDNVEFWHFLIVAPVSAKGIRGWKHLWNIGSFAVDILCIVHKVLIPMIIPIQKSSLMSVSGNLLQYEIMERIP